MSTHFVVGNLLKTIKRIYQAIFFLLCIKKKTVQKLFFLFTRKWVLQRSKKEKCSLSSINKFLKQLKVLNITYIVCLKTY